LENEGTGRKIRDEKKIMIKKYYMAPREVGKNIIESFGRNPGKKIRGHELKFTTQQNILAQRKLTKRDSELLLPGCAYICPTWENPPQSLTDIRVESTEKGFFRRSRESTRRIKTFSLIHSDIC